MLAQCCHLVLFHPKIRRKKKHLFYSDSNAQDIIGFLFLALLLPNKHLNKSNKVSFGGKKQHGLICIGNITSDISKLLYVISQAVR